MATEFVLWGYKPFLPLPLPIALTGGNLRHCRVKQRSRAAEGWQVAIYRQGDAPTGLRLQVAQAAGITLDDALAHLEANQR